MVKFHTDLRTWRPSQMIYNLYPNYQLNNVKATKKVLDVKHFRTEKMHHVWWWQTVTFIKEFNNDVVEAIQQKNRMKCSKYMTCVSTIWYYEMYKKSENSEFVFHTQNLDC